jgi:hypothetical protein
VLALKGNQGTLHDDVIRYFDDTASKTTTAKPVVEGDHGRIETRTATVSIVNHGRDALRRFLRV